MKVFSTLNKQAMIAMMIAATGLPASMASAQFKVEYADKADKSATKAPEHDAKHQEHRSVIVIQSDDNDHEYEIKIVDGKIDYAKRDGKEVDSQLIELKGNVVLFLNDDGEVIYKLNIPEIADAPRGAHAVHDSSSWSSQSGNEFVLKNDGEHEMSLHLVVAPNDQMDKDAKHQVILHAEQPKVMLGINLGEPSKILRKHLKLKDGQHAILVEKVIKGLPAAKAGLEDFDVIVSIDGSDGADGEVLGKAMSQKEAGDTLKLVVLRSGDTLKLKVKLAAYDPEALGVNMANADEDANIQEFIVHEDDDADHDRQHEFQVLKGKLEQRFGDPKENRQMAMEMQRKAMEAMGDAQRQIMEFRDGRLIVRSAKELEGRINQLNGRVIGRLGEINPEELNGHLEEMDHRLGMLEDRLDRQMDQMSRHMDRLAAMFERMMDRMDRDHDEDDD